MPKVKKKLKEPEFYPIESFQLCEGCAYGVSLIEFPIEDGEVAYRAMLELHLETSKSHMITMMLDVYELDASDAAREAVICGSRIAPGHYEKINVFDEEGSVIRTHSESVTDILELLEFQEDSVEQEIPENRVLH